MTPPVRLAEQTSGMTSRRRAALACARMNFVQKDGKSRPAIGTSTDRLFENFFLNILRKTAPHLQRSLPEKLHRA